MNYERGQDYIVRGMAAGGQIRCFAITSRNLTEEARQRHGTSPVTTAALGRLLSGGAMMGIMMKGEKDLLTLQIQGDGPVQGITVTADSFGHVKGYPVNPVVLLPPSREGKLDVGKAIGSGVLTVIRDVGLKEPYAGQVQLVSGEIAEDLTYYFAVSEQTPSSVALGVLMNQNNTVSQAGGYIIQLMPGTSEAVIAKLEHRLSETRPVTTLLSQGYSPEGILEEILEGLDVSISPDCIPASFSCHCSKERMAQALISLGSKELDRLIEEQESIEMQCHFCNSKYSFSVNDLKNIRKA